MIHIQKLRQTANLTQLQVAEKLNVTPSTVAKWETGSSFPRASLLPTLADLFHCTIDELYGREKR